MVLIWTSLILLEIEHFFMYLLVIWKFSFANNDSFLNTFLSENISESSSHAERCCISLPTWVIISKPWHLAVLRMAPKPEGARKRSWGMAQATLDILRALEAPQPWQELSLYALGLLWSHQLKFPQKLGEMVYISHWGLKAHSELQPLLLDSILLEFGLWIDFSDYGGMGKNRALSLSSAPKWAGNTQNWVCWPGLAFWTLKT